MNQQLKSPHVDTIVVPKAQSASDLRLVHDVIRHVQSTGSSKTIIKEFEAVHRPPPRLLPLIETAKGLINLSEICKASPLVTGLAFAAEDFCLDLSVTRTPGLTELLFARSAIVTAARAHKLPSAIDLVCTAFKGKEGQNMLREESESGKGLGFNGKQIIHPSQIDIVHKAFGRSEEEVNWAVRVVIADAKAAEAGRGSWTLDGKMIDIPVARKAKDIVSKAEVCGFDLNALRTKWQNQEPE